MAKSVIGALRVNLGLNSAQFIRGTQQAKTSMQKLSTFMKVGGLAIAGALGTATAAMGKLAWNSIQVADEISKAALSIGIGTEELSRLRYAADLSGVSFGQLQTGVGRLSRNMLDASRGLSAPARAFDQLGVSVINSSGKLRSSTEVIGDVADRFSKMEDGAEKTALAMEVFGRAGASMIPMLNGGRDALEKLTEEADRFGIVIDAETGRRAEAFNDNLTRLKGVFEALATRIAAQILPTLVKFTDWLVENAESIVAVAEGLANFTSRLGGFISRIADYGRRLYDQSILFRTIADALGWVAQRVFGPLPGAGANGIRAGLAALTAAARQTHTGMLDIFDATETIGSTGGAAIRRGITEPLAAANDNARQLAVLMDRIYPDRARINRLQQDLATIAPDDLISRLRVLDEFETQRRGERFQLRGVGDLESIKPATEEVDKAIKDLTRSSETGGRSIQRSFADTAQSVVSSLQQMAMAAQGGGLLGILSSVIGLGLQLGSIGVFGKTFANNINKVPAFAGGTNYAPGGLSLVGERGPELVSLPRGSQVIPNGKLGGMGQQHLHVTVSAAPELYVQVDRRAQGQIINAAPALANAGAQQAMAMSASAGRRTVRR